MVTYSSSTRQAKASAWLKKSARLAERGRIRVKCFSTCAPPRLAELVSLPDLVHQVRVKWT
jgi:hypothetical protein